MFTRLVSVALAEFEFQASRVVALPELSGKT